MHITIKIFIRFLVSRFLVNHLLENHLTTLNAKKKKRNSLTLCHFGGLFHNNSQLKIFAQVSKHVLIAWSLKRKRTLSTLRIFSSPSIYRFSLCLSQVFSGIHHFISFFSFAKFTSQQNNSFTDISIAVCRNWLAKSSAITRAY